jgi:plasmid maintenance system killer protein
VVASVLAAGSAMMEDQAVEEALRPVIALRCGNRAGMHSIRVNAQYRICFRWMDAGAIGVEIADYHH